MMFTRRIRKGGLQLSFEQHNENDTNEQIKIKNYLIFTILELVIITITTFIGWEIKKILKFTTEQEMYFDAFFYFFILKIVLYINNFSDRGRYKFWFRIGMKLRCCCIRIFGNFLIKSYCKFEIRNFNKQDRIRIHSYLMLCGIPSDIIEECGIPTDIIEEHIENEQIRAIDEEEQ